MVKLEDLQLGQIVLINYYSQEFLGEICGIKDLRSILPIICFTPRNFREGWFAENYSFYDRIHSPFPRYKLLQHGIAYFQVSEIIKIFPDWSW